jgi:4-hydroxy-tetrahydrodipicolinate synthase
MKGVYTAIVTPFDETGTIDYETYGNLIEIQIKAGVAGIVPAGTTGESPALTEDELKDLIKFSVEKSAGRIKVIAGTGCNCTAKAVRMAKYAAELRADGALVVAPYYNKPTPEGMFGHYKAISDEADIPIVVYNVPGRTGKNIDTSTMKRIAGLKNIIAVKEASGDVNQMMDVINSCPEIDVLSGDDSLTLPLIAAGGKGIISVLSNLFPEDIVKMTDLALAGNFESARDIHYRLWDFFKAEFCESNPIPIKYMMYKKGLLKEIYRLPMCPLSESSKQMLNKLLN